MTSLHWRQKGNPENNREREREREREIKFKQRMLLLNTGIKTKNKREQKSILKGRRKYENKKRICLHFPKQKKSIASTFRSFSQHNTLNEESLNTYCLIYSEAKKKLLLMLRVKGDVYLHKNIQKRTKYKRLYLEV